MRFTLRELLAELALAKVLEIHAPLALGDPPKKEIRMTG